MNRRLFGPMLLAVLLAGCNLPGRQPATPTLSSDQVLQTAQAIAQATLAAATPTPTQLPPSPTPAPPTDTPTPQPTATPSSPIVTANYNANIRRGPGEGYEGLDFLLGGAQAAVLGRYDNSPIGTWWYIRPISGGREGWVWSGAVSFSGSDFGIPVLTPAPTSTPRPEPTSTSTSTATHTRRRRPPSCGSGGGGQTRGGERLSPSCRWLPVTRTEETRVRRLPRIAY